jgi:fluoride exporter
MERFLWVCVGGAAGSGARYLLSGWVLEKWGAAFPWGTLAVNVLGSFLLGLLMVLGFESDAFPPTLRIALTTGVMGGFTTYSTFNYETLKFVETGAWLPALANVLLTVLVCLVAGFLGHGLGRWIVAR